MLFGQSVGGPKVGGSVGVFVLDAGEQIFGECEVGILEDGRGG